MTRPTSYSVASYGAMINDRTRMPAYALALRRTVTPGSLVVDLGAGTGIFSLLACQLGARHVHVIEPDGSIDVARYLVEANGYGSRVTFHQKLSTEVTLPERADVVVSDLRGVLPLLQRHIPSIADARRRFLAQGGRLIPRADSLWVALAHAPDLAREASEPWLENEYGLDLRAGHSFAASEWRRASLTGDQIVSEARRWAVLDYATIESPTVSGEVTWELGAAGVAHGLAIWFDADLTEGAGFSNAPGLPATIYGQAFFPWPETVSWAAGERISVRLRADLVGGDYVWQWRTRVGSDGSEGRVARSFDQSTFFATPFSAARLRRHEASHVPELALDGQVDAFLLAQMDGRTDLAEIARRAAERFPHRFASSDDALERAGEISDKYGCR